MSQNTLLDGEEYARFLEDVADHDRLSTGQMARLNCISEKTLRLYQEKGVLDPVEIDPETGYRSYSLGQSFVLDRILRYQNMGFSLSEIKLILDNEENLTVVVPMLEKRLDVVKRQKLDLNIVESSLMDYLAATTLGTTRDVIGELRLEWQPDRYRLDFDLPLGGYDMPVRYTDENATLWCYVLRHVRQEMHRRSIPLVLFDNVFDHISRHDLETRNLIISKACVHVDETVAAHLDDVRLVPAGLYLTYCFNEWTLEDGRAAERTAIERMLDHIAENDLVIRGDYFGEGNIDRSIDNSVQPTFVKLHIPVSIAQ